MKESLEIVWSQIVEELAALQDSKPEGYDRPIFNPYTDRRVGTLSRTAEEVAGGVVNPVCGYSIEFDTACAANVFATEYCRTDDETWRDRATRALRTLNRWEPYSGISEPRWDPMGWHFAEGSLSVTGTVLDAYWETSEVLTDEPTEGTVDEAWGDLAAYLERCRHGTGRFAHNAVPGDASVGDVQNTTTFAYFLRQYASRNDVGFEDRLGDTPGDAVDHLVDGQRSDGLWPYIYPSRIQRRLYRIPAIRNALAHKLFQKTVFRSDASIFFGDSVHHCYVLYYLLKGTLVGDGTVPERTIREAWNWIESRFEHAGDGAIRFDFGWEAGPNRVRFCNFYDVTTYFLVLALLPLLREFGTIDAARADEVGTKLVRYLRRQLFVPDNTPCFPAHECDYETRRNILPAVWGGSSLKGSLLACYLGSDISSADVERSPIESV